MKIKVWDPRYYSNTYRVRETDPKIGIMKVLSKLQSTNAGPIEWTINPINGEIIFATFMDYYGIVTIEVIES